MKLNLRQNDLVDPLPYFLTTLTAVCFEFHYHFENISFWSKIEKILNHCKYFDYNELLFTLISTGAPYYVKFNFVELNLCTGVILLTFWDFLTFKHLIYSQIHK